MIPVLRENDTVLVNRLSYFLSKPKVGDVVVLRREQFIIKRIARIKDNRVFIVGDNKSESTDSRSFGWLNKELIIGKVMFKI